MLTILPANCNTTLCPIQMDIPIGRLDDTDTMDGRQLIVYVGKSVSAPNNSFRLWKGSFACDGMSKEMASILARN